MNVKWENRIIKSLNFFVKMVIYGELIFIVATITYGVLGVFG